MVLPKRLEISIPPSVTSIAEAAVGRDTIMRAVASAVLQVRGGAAAFAAPGAWREGGAECGEWGVEWRALLLPLSTCCRLPQTGRNCGTGPHSTRPPTPTRPWSKRLDSPKTPPQPTPLPPPKVDSLEQALLAALPLGPQTPAGGVTLPDSFSGELTINIREARDLPVWGFPWQSNPYVMLVLGEQAVRSRRDNDTSQASRHRAPVWNQEVQFLALDKDKQVGGGPGGKQQAAGWAKSRGGGGGQRKGPSGEARSGWTFNF